MLPVWHVVGHLVGGHLRPRCGPLHRCSCGNERRRQCRLLFPPRDRPADEVTPQGPCPHPSHSVTPWALPPDTAPFGRGLPPMTTAAPAGLAVATRGLTKRFGSRTVVDHVDIAIPAGSVCGFVGPDGAGET